MSLADRIVLLNNGRVEQIGTPEDVYEAPATLFVAGFIGASGMNLLPGHLRCEGSGCTVELGHAARLSALPPRSALNADLPVMVGVRPEHLHWAQGDDTALCGTARVVEPLGSDTLVVFDVAGRELQARLPPRLVRRAGDPVRVAAAPEAIHLFDPESGRRL